MIRFVNEHRDRFGVELICQVLRPAVRGFFTSRGYRAAVGRAPSARQLQDDLLVPEIARLHAENYGVYGRRKMHALMRLAGVRGVRKWKRVFTTRSDTTTVLPSDLVNRRFTAPAPRRLWDCDVTYVATWSGFAYVAFVTDVYSHRIVGWNVAATLRSEILPMQALDMAAWNAGGRLDGLIHHADHGSNYTAMVYTERIVELGAVPSTGTVGDSLYKTELIRQRGPWRTVEQVELATSNGCGGGTTPASTASSTCEHPPRSNRRITLTRNQPIRHLSDKAPDRNESQADSLLTSWGCADFMKTLNDASLRVLTDCPVRNNVTFALTDASALAEVALPTHSISSLTHRGVHG